MKTAKEYFETRLFNNVSVTKIAFYTVLALIALG